MKTKNAIWSKWMRRLSGLMVTLLLTMSFAGQASAIILFQDDSQHDIDSEAILINADGTPGTDQAQIAVDGSGDVTITADGGDISFSDENLAGTGGLDFDGVINFSNAASLAMPQGTPNPATCTEGDLFYNTSSNTTYVCTDTTLNTWTAFSTGTQDFETVYGADADKSLSVTDNLAIGFEIKEGANSYFRIVTTDAGEQVQINEDAVIGDGGDTVTINSSDWDISATGDISGAGSITADGLITGTAGATISGAASSINANSNFTTAINTGTSTGAVTIGGGSNTVAIDTTSWDISSAGVASGFTGITSTGTINFSGASAYRIREVAGITNPGTSCTTAGEMIMDTTTQILYVCTVPATNTWAAVEDGGDADTLDSLDSTQFLRADASDTYGDGGTYTLTVGSDDTLQVDGTFDANGVVTIGDNGDTVAIDSSSWDISSAGVGSGFTGFSTGGTVSLGDNSGTVTIDSSDWDISATGDMTGIGAVTMDGLLTGTAGATLSGAAISLNNNSNFAVNIGTGTSTGAVSIGGGSNTVAIDTTSWDISSAGVASGFTGITSTGVVNFSGTSEFRIREVADEAAAICTTVGEIVLDTTEDVIYTCTGTGNPGAWAAAAHNADTMMFEPEYPNYVLWGDGGSNNGKMEALYDGVNREHYYHWTTLRADPNDYDIRFRAELPADLKDITSLTYKYRTQTSATADSSIQVVVRNDTDNVNCHDDGEIANTGGNEDTWETATITNVEIDACAGGNVMVAGDVMEVIIKLKADNIPNFGYADVGTLKLNYTN